jgi:hypothetical protein
MPTKTPRPAPAIYYKYCSAARVDILEHQRLRFTPRGELNDPFELLMSAKFLERPSEQKGLAKAIAGELAKLQTSQRAANPSLLEVPAETLYQHSLGKLRSTEQIALAKQASIEAMIRRSAQFRILCLCGTAPDNPKALPMWTHYAVNHTGFALGFDATHPWFPPSGSAVRGALCRRVMYKTTRHDVNHPDEQAVFFRKARCWAYEDEYRIVKDITNAWDLETESVDALAHFPASALVSVTLGARCQPPTIGKILLILRNTAFRHVRLYYGVTSTDTYSITCSTEAPSPKAREIMDKVYGRRTS